MVEVDKEEMAQWIQGMESLFQDFVRIVGRITKAWEKGLADYRKVWAEGELPATLEKLKEMPVPKESNCKSAKKSFEKGIDAQIKAWMIQAKYAGETAPDRIWKPRMVGWLATSQSMLKNMLSDLDSVRKKHQV